MDTGESRASGAPGNAAISCPTLVCDAEGDIFFKGQPEELFDHLTCEKTFLRFTEAEGAGAHCGQLRLSTRFFRVLTG